jgi:hypothetical protein
MVSLFNVIFVRCIYCPFCNIVAKGINLMGEIGSTVGFLRKVFFGGYLGHVFGVNWDTYLWSKGTRSGRDHGRSQIKRESSNKIS